MPHAFLSFQNAYPSIKFESDVTLGHLHVFYTQGFNGTTPYLFQLTQVFPFLINPVLTILLLPSFLYVAYLGVRRKSYSHLLVALFFFAVFFFQGHFFAKWTRYYIPTLPFAAVVLSVGISSFYSYLLKRKLFPNLFLASILLISFIYALLFFVYVYVHTSTQIAAANWLKKHNPNIPILISEPYDLGIAPFHTNTNKVEFVNFYELDNDPTVQLQLDSLLNKDTYVILPSQRLLRSRTLSPKSFPISSVFYKTLSDQTGFEKIYQTECDLFCKIIYLGDPVLNLEETTSVFDRPIVTIYKSRK